MKNLEVLGSELKSYVEALGSDFIECSYLIDIIYEIFDDNNIEYPNDIEVYSDSEIDIILNLIYDNKSNSSTKLGQLVYDHMSKLSN